MERHPGGVFLSEIGVFEGYESGRLLFQIVYLFVPFKRLPLNNNHIKSKTSIKEWDNKI